MPTINIYPLLKTMLLLLPKAPRGGDGGFAMMSFAEGDDSYHLHIQKNHLIIGFICPEVSEADEKDFNRANLKPYELAVNRFGISDHKYDVSMINPPEKREIVGINRLMEKTLDASSVAPIIVTYLQFEEL